jgi:hypothetical protein
MRVAEDPDDTRREDAVREPDGRGRVADVGPQFLGRRRREAELRQPLGRPGVAAGRVHV